MENRKNIQFNKITFGQLNHPGVKSDDVLLWRRTHLFVIIGPTACHNRDNSTTISLVFERGAPERTFLSEREPTRNSTCLKRLDPSSHTLNVNTIEKNHHTQAHIRNI